MYEYEMENNVSLSGKSEGEREKGKMSAPEKIIRVFMPTLMLYKFEIGDL